MYFTLISFFLFCFAPSKSSLFNQYLRLNLSSTTATLETEENGRCREILNKSQCIDVFCPPGREKVAVVERWPLVEFRLYWRKSRNMTIAKS